MAGPPPPRPPELRGGARPSPETTATAEDKLRFSGNVRRLRLRPGDVVIVESDLPISREQAGELYKQLDETFPRNEVLLLSQGLHVSKVLRPDDKTPVPPDE